MTDKVEIPIGFKDDGSTRSTVDMINEAMRLFKAAGEDVRKLKREYIDSPFAKNPAFARALLQSAREAAEAAGLQVKASERVVAAKEKEARAVKNAADRYAEYRKEAASGYNESQGKREEIESRKAIRDAETRKRYDQQRRDPLGLERTQRASQLPYNNVNIPDLPLPSEEDLRRTRDRGAKEARERYLRNRQRIDDAFEDVSRNTERRAKSGSEDIFGDIRSEVSRSIERDRARARYYGGDYNVVGDPTRGGTRGPGGRGPGGPGSPPGGGEPPDDRGKKLQEYNKEVLRNRQYTNEAGVAGEYLTHSLYRTGKAAQANTEYLIRNAHSLQNLRRVGLLVGNVSDPGSGLSLLGYSLAGGIGLAGIVGLGFVARGILNKTEEIRKDAEDNLQKVIESANVGLVGSRKERLSGQEKLSNEVQEISSIYKLEGYASAQARIRKLYNADKEVPLSFGEELYRHSALAFFATGGESAYYTPTKPTVPTPETFITGEEVKRQQAFNDAYKEGQEALQAFRGEYQSVLREFNTQPRTDASFNEFQRRLADLQERAKLNQVDYGAVTSKDPYVAYSEQESDEFKKFQERRKKESLDWAKFQAGLYNQLAAQYKTTNSIFIQNNPYAQVYAEAKDKADALDDTLGELTKKVTGVSSGSYLKNLYDTTTDVTTRSFANYDEVKRIREDAESGRINASIRLKELNEGQIPTLSYDVVKNYKELKDTVLLKDDERQEIESGWEQIGNAQLASAKKVTQGRIAEETRYKLALVDLARFEKLTLLQVQTSLLEGGTGENDPLAIARQGRAQRASEFAISQAELSKRAAELRGGYVDQDQEFRRQALEVYSSVFTQAGVYEANKAIVNFTQGKGVEDIKRAGIDNLVREAVISVQDYERANAAFRQVPADVQVARASYDLAQRQLEGLGKLDTPEKRQLALVYDEAKQRALQGVSPEHLNQELVDLQIKTNKETYSLLAVQQKDGQALFTKQNDVLTSLEAAIRDLPKELEGVSIVELRDEAALGTFKVTILGRGASYLSGSAEGAQ